MGRGSNSGRSATVMPVLAPSPMLEHWRQIADSAIDTAIITTDLQGRISSWNAGARQILGWDEAEMVGRTLEALFIPEDRERGVLAVEMNEAAKGGRGGEEGWRLRKDGTRVWAAGSMSGIFSPAGELLGFVKIVRDRTRQRETKTPFARSAARSKSSTGRFGPGS